MFPHAAPQGVFAPVVALYRFSNFKYAVASVNRSRYGLQAGVFTTSLPHTLMAFDRIEAADFKRR
jgi:acyl-CoA reductase-like NAD-dependent aldehyde dehydrogenase